MVERVDEIEVPQPHSAEVMANVLVQLITSYLPVDTSTSGNRGDEHIALGSSDANYEVEQRI